MCWGRGQAELRELQEESEGRAARQRERRAAIEADAERRLPRLLAMAVSGGLIDEREAGELARNVEDGYASAVSNMELWEDQLEKAGLLKDARAKRERRLASEGARRLIGKRVDVCDDWATLETRLNELVRTPSRRNQRRARTDTTAVGCVCCRCGRAT